MFQLAMTLLPLYLMIINLQMANSYFALAVIYVSTSIPFNIWMMKGFYDTIPKSLEESAYVEGASAFGSFYQIILPLAKTAVALTAWGIYSEGALITALPVMILFICLSKYLVGGLTVGGVKG